VTGTINFPFGQAYASNSRDFAGFERQIAAAVDDDGLQIAGRFALKAL